MFNLFGGKTPGQSILDQEAKAQTADKKKGSDGAAGAADEKPYTGSGFDPTGLERAAKAARMLDESKNSAAAIAIAKEQEKTKQAAHNEKVKEYEAHKAAYDMQRVEKEGEQKRLNMAAETENHKKRANYKDQLDRKRMADQIAAEKYMREEELKKQEEKTAREEAMKRKTLEYEAELRQKTEMAKVAAETEGRIRQERENHDLHMSEAMLQANQFRQTVLEGIKLAGSTIGDGVSAFLSDSDRMMAAVSTLSLLAVGVYTAKVGTGVAGRFIEARLGKPSLVRETSRMGLLQKLRNPVPVLKRAFRLNKPTNALEGVVLAPGLEQRLSAVATSTANTKKNGAPFRHLLLHGPPGTGKTLFAKSLAQHSGLEYAILTGGDVAPLGREAVTEIHKLFDWATSARRGRGLLLFVDEADAFLQRRSSAAMSEDMRNALNAFLYRTGTESDKFMVVLASNQPDQFDWAINDRIDEMVEFQLPGREERLRILNLYWDRFIVKSGGSTSSRIHVVLPQNIKAEKAEGGGEGVRTPATPEQEDDEDTMAATLQHVADKTEGFSGRELSKLVIAWQASAYGTRDSVLTVDMMWSVVDAHVGARVRKTEWYEASEVERKMRVGGGMSPAEMADLVGAHETKKKK